MTLTDIQEHFFNEIWTYINMDVHFYLICKAKINNNGQLDLNMCIFN